MKKLLKFKTEGCSQCKALTPTLNRVLQEYPDIELIEIDCDTEENFIEEYKIHNLPTLVYLIDNKEVGRTIGAVPANKIKQLLING